MRLCLIKLRYRAEHSLTHKYISVRTMVTLQIPACVAASDYNEAYNNE